MGIIIILIIPIIDIVGHRLLWKINKGLYVDMYIPEKEDREKIWEVLNKDVEEDNKLDVWERF